MKENFKKLKFYDKTLWILLYSFTSFFITMIIIGLFWILLLKKSLYIVLLYIVGLIGVFSFLSVTTFLVCLVIITWGMIYHQIKRRDWGWIFLSLVLFFLIGVWLSSILYYFIVMRKEFKGGKGIYKDKISAKEMKRIEYYKKHKDEIDKKENEDFIKFLKWIGIILGILILGYIVYSIFF